MMGAIKVWKEGAAKEPAFPSNFKVDKKAVLQVTDIKTNKNKYYAIELHSAKSKYRVYTHYGRTDDLNTNPNAGVRESRYFTSLADAQGTYDKIYKQKTSKTKGYKEVHLASTKIGSSKSAGKSSGHVDDDTLKKLSDVKKTAPKKVKSVLSTDIQKFVDMIYAEATNALTSTVNASITANGIETPLGVLTIGQIEKGQDILDELWKLYQKKKKTQSINEQMLDLSSDFYSAIPHRLGRTRTAISQGVINTLGDFKQKQDTLQLMRDMLSVNGDHSVLLNPEIDKKYKALDCEIKELDSKTYDKIKNFVEKPKKKGGGIKVKRIFSIARKGEAEAFLDNMSNKQLLFHGSDAKNWVGILSRGLLLPKIVVKMGVRRTDSGWLGHGIYFGDAVSTSYSYASPTKKNTVLITIANVALGKVHKYKRITYGLMSPPKGYDSCHGVRGAGSDFYDDEYVIYSHNQQKLQYLIEV